MKTRNQLIELLSNRQINKILIAESHPEHAAKDLIIDNIDLFIDPNITGNRKVIIVLEHLSSLYNGTLKEASDGKTVDLDSAAIATLTGVYHSKKYSRLIQTALRNGLQVVGAENQRTGFTSCYTNLKERIVVGNQAFAEEITKSSSPDNIVIFLGGALHIKTVFKGNNEQGTFERVSNAQDTVSWYATDVDNAEAEKHGRNEVVDFGNVPPVEFDIVSKTVPRDRTEAAAVAEADEPQLLERMLALIMGAKKENTRFDLKNRTTIEDDFNPQGYLGKINSGSSSPSFFSPASSPLSSRRNSIEIPIKELIAVEEYLFYRTPQR